MLVLFINICPSNNSYADESIKESRESDVIDAETYEKLEPMQEKREDGFNFFGRIFEEIGFSDGSKDNKVLRRKMTDSKDVYLTNEYTETIAPAISKVESAAGDVRNIHNIYDGNYGTTWKTGKLNNDTFKNTITFTFKETSDISTLLLAGRSGWSSALPIEFTIFASQTDDKDDFVEVAKAKQPDPKGEKYEIKFSKVITAKRIRLVYDKHGAGGYYETTISEMRFLKHDTLVEEIENMFTTKERYELKSEYKSIEKLKQLEKSASGHFLEEEIMKQLERGKLILDGVIDENNNPDNDFPYEVSTIQKTGSDSENLVFLFMGDGYTKEQQDKFVKDVNERFKELLLWEPYRSLANNINAYAIKTVSNEEGLGRFASAGVSVIKKDTFYGIQHNYTGMNRLLWYGKGNTTAPMVKEFTEKYLDKGAKVASQEILSNSTHYGGSGGSVSMSTLSAGVKMVIHEGAHSYAKLTDEYSTGAEETRNRTSISDPTKVKWKEFLGYRQTGIVPYGAGYNSTHGGQCIMESIYSNKYDEACKLRVFDQFNENIGYQHSEYVADGLITVEAESDEEQYSRPKKKIEIRNSNILEAENEILSFRTIMRNYTEQKKQINLKLTITDKEGKIKNEVSENFILGARQEINKIFEYGDDMKSLEIKTAMLTDIEETDLIIGTITDITDSLNPKIIKTDKDHYAPMGRVQVKAYLGNDTDRTPIAIPNVEQISDIPIEAGKEYSINPPNIKDYTYVTSDVIDNKLTVAEGQNEVNLYYAKSRVPLTLQLVGPGGKIVTEVKKHLRYKEKYTPSKFDFSGVNTDMNENIDLDKIKLPTGNAVSDGINEIVLQYHYSGTLKQVEVVAVDESNKEIGRKNLGAKLPGETLEISALTNKDISNLEVYKLKDENKKIIILDDTEESKDIIFKYERMKKSFRVVAKDQGTGKELVEISNEIKNTNTNVLVREADIEEKKELEQYSYKGEAEYLVSIINDENAQEHVLPYERIKKDIDIVAKEGETGKEIGRVTIKNQKIGDKVTAIAPTKDDIADLANYKLESSKEQLVLVSSGDDPLEIDFIYKKKDNEVYGEFKLGYWKNGEDGFVLEGKAGLENVSLKKNEVKKFVEVVDLDGTIIKSTPASVTNWYDKNDYNGFQVYMNKEYMANLPNGDFKIQVRVNYKNIDYISPITENLELRGIGSYVDKIENISSYIMGKNFISFVKMNNQLTMTVEGVKPGLNKLFMYKNSKNEQVIDGWANVSFDFNKKNIKELVITGPKGDKDVRYRKELATWNINKQYNMGVVSTLEKSGFQAVVPRKFGDMVFKKYLLIKDEEGKEVLKKELK